MKNFKYAYLSISKKIFLNLIIMVQVVVVSYMIYSFLNINENISKETDKILSVFNNKKVCYMKVGNDFTDKLVNDKIESSKVIEAYTILKDSKEFTHLYLGRESLYVEEFNGIEKLRCNPSSTVIDEINYLPINLLKIDNDTYKQFGLEVEEGTTFGEVDFKEEQQALPIIIGEKYLSSYKVGDIIKYADNNEIKDAKIIGVFKENSYMLHKVNSSNKFVDLNNSIVAPYVDIDKLQQEKLLSNYNSQVFNMFNTSYLLFDNSKSNDEINTIIEDLNKKFQEMGLGKQDIKNVDEYLKESTEFLSAQKDNTSMITLITTFFLSIGIISSFMHSIKADKKLYGIHILNGATLNDICIRLFEQILIMFIIGLIAATGIIKTTFGSIKYEFIIQIIMLLVIIDIFISIIPTIIIKKLNVNDLIKGGE